MTWCLDRRRLGGLVPLGFSVDGPVVRGPIHGGSALGVIGGLVTHLVGLVLLASVIGCTWTSCSWQTVPQDGLSLCGFSLNYSGPSWAPLGFLLLVLCSGHLNI